MKQLITQYGGLKKEIYILFIGKLVTAMGSFVWPMLTFFLTTKLGLSDSTATLMIATASILSFPAALLGGKLAALDLGPDGLHDLLIQRDDAVVV